MFKDIPGWEGQYQVDELGTVRAYRLLQDNTHLVTPQTDKDGYKIVRLHDLGTGRTAMFRVHRAVALAFIPNPYNKRCVNHIDNNPANNDVSNLEWCTHKENTAWCHTQHRDRHRCRRVTIYDDLGNLVGTYTSTVQAAKCTGLSRKDLYKGKRGYIIYLGEKVVV